MVGQLSSTMRSKDHSSPPLIALPIPMTFTFSSSSQEGRKSGNEMPFPFKQMTSKLHIISNILWVGLYHWLQTAGEDTGKYYFLLGIHMPS